MKKRAVLMFVATLISFAGFSQAFKSFNAGPLNRKYTICDNDTVKVGVLNFVYQPGIPVFKINWLDSPVPEEQKTLLEPKFVLPRPGTYTFHVELTDTITKHSLRDTFVITQIGKPEVEVGNDTSLCLPDEYTLGVIYSNYLAEEVFWEHNGKGELLDSTTYTPTYIPSSEDNGKIEFIFNGQGVAGCGEITDTINITYYNRPTVNILTLPDSICSNEELSMEAEATGYTNLQWKIYPDNNQKGNIINDTSLIATYIPHPEESGEVKLILDAIGEGCIESDTLVLHLSSMYIVSTNDTTICEGETIDLSVTSLPGLTYQWSTGGTRNYITIKEAQVTEEYIVEVWNEAGCYFTDTILVEVIPSPHLTITIDEEEELITVDPFDLSRYIFYVNADTLQDGINNTFNYSDYIEIYDTIYVMAYNADGCASYGDEDYAIIDDGIVDPPLEKVNAFSPNGDGINDRLMEGRKVTVMDRTSKILYEGYDGWDGTFNGKEMPQGTYFYILYDDEGKLFYKGPVTILR